MKKSFKYRIYPNKKQHLDINNILLFCMELYNSAIQERKSFYKTFNKDISFGKQSSYLPEIKKIFPNITSIIYAQCLQSVLKSVDYAYKNFFRKCKLNKIKKGIKYVIAGYPRFKSINRFNQITFPQSDFIGTTRCGGGVKLISNNKIKVFGIGEIKIKYHRPFEGNCKTVQIKKEGSKYFIILSCDNVPEKRLPKTNKIIAIDLGLTTFATTDSGIKFKHPKPYKTAKEKLALANQKLARKQGGSKNRRKSINDLRKVHTKIANIRDDWQHKLANKLIKESDTIIVEKLNITGMLEDKGFIVNNENISDASWGNFVNKLKYKAESAGRSIIEVNPKNTSKMCSCCNNINKELTLKDRIYDCIKCGMILDRDINAAINIKRLGTSLAIDSNISISEVFEFIQI